MLDLLAAVGGGGFALVSLWVGLRLTWRGVRDQSLPELTIGAALGLAGGVGYPLVSIAQMMPDLSDESRTLLVGLHIASTAVGLSALALFTRRVFRPASLWAGALMLAVPAVEIVLMVLQMSGPGLLVYATEISGPWVVNTYVSIFCLMWAGGESLAQYDQARRRVRLGLGSRVVANRMLLWGISMGTASLISSLTMALEAMGIPTIGTALGNLIIGSLGFVAATGVYLAFMPPAAYLRWLRADQES